MKSVPSLLLFATLLLAIACERELEIPFPEHEPRLVVNSLAASGQPIRAVVSRSRGMGERVREIDVYLTDATVELWQNGQQVETLTFRDDNGFMEYGYFSEHLAEAGSQYELRVSHPDFPDLRQEMGMPSVPRVSDISVAFGADFDQEGNRIDRFTYQLQDPADTLNYYAVHCLFTPGPGSGQPFASYSLSLDGTLRENTDFSSFGYELVSDQGVDGQPIALSFETSTFDQFWDLTEADMRGGQIVLELSSLNEPMARLGTEYGEHVASSRFIDFDLSVLILSPLPMYSNAEGGFGIFGGYTVRTDTLEW